MNFQLVNISGFILSVSITAIDNYLKTHTEAADIAQL